MMVFVNSNLSIGPVPCSIHIVKKYIKQLLKKNNKKNESGLKKSVNHAPFSFCIYCIEVAGP